MKAPSFRPAQFYYLRRMSHGPVPFEVWRKWDQRPLRGLWVRKMFTIDRQHAVRITSAGDAEVKKTQHAQYRTNWERPVFKSDRTDVTEIRKRA